MKKLIVFALFSLGTIMLLGGCVALGGHHVATGSVTTRTFQVDDFTAFNTGGNRDVVFRQGETSSVTITMQESLFDVLRIDVRSGTLDIGFDGSVSGANRQRVYVYASRPLQAVTLSGSVSATANDAAIFANDVTVAISGSGSVNFSLDVTQLDITSSGSSSLEFSGYADTVDIQRSGTGSISAFDLTARNVSISRSGSSRVDISVSDDLTVNSSGSGQIRYRGNPGVSIRSSGSGTVVRVD